MAWNQVALMEQKQQFVSLAATGRFTFTELCADYHVSRKTGHKWVVRYRKEGTAGLRERRTAGQNSRTGSGLGAWGCGWRLAHLAGMKSVVISNPEILSGTPVFAGTRVPVKNLTDYLEGGSTIDEFLDERRFNGCR